MKRFKGRHNNRGPGRGNSGPRLFNQKKIKTKNTNEPAEFIIPELAEYYFDCSSFNETDRYINTKEKIIQYLGTKYGGDVRISLEKMSIYQIPFPKDVSKHWYHFDIHTTTMKFIEFRVRISQ